MNKVNKSIGWAQYTRNPLTGCLNNTDGLCNGGDFPCYAKRLTDTRLRDRYLANPYLPELFTMKGKDDPFYPRIWPDRFTVKGIPKGSLIFIDNMGDWLGIGVPDEWVRMHLDFFRANPDHTFLTLTKQPQNLPKFSPFPDNCGVGQTLTAAKDSDFATLYNKMYIFKDLIASVKFISFEPLLGNVDLPNIKFLEQGFRECGINWLIIGACTGTKTEMSELVRKYPDLTLMPYGKKWTAQPKIEWVQEIVDAADRAKIPIFLKDNLWPLIEKQPQWGTFADCNYTAGQKGGEEMQWYLRQELPR